MADVIAFPVKPQSVGNGAREALNDIAGTLPSTLKDSSDALCWADWVLAELWERGFKVVPMDDIA